MNSLFTNRPFISHSGLPLDWQIDCRSLSLESIKTLALIISRTYSFNSVYGVPRGGLRIARELRKYKNDHQTLLIVDDVFTTGESLMEAREKANAIVNGPKVCVVIFARNQVPPWVHPIFQLTLPDSNNGDPYE